MRKFNSIKKSRKKSKDIDEKIEYLDKECLKTGLNEITMSTADIYQGTTQVPNQDFINFQGQSQGGYGLGISGADGNSVGGASIDTIPSGFSLAGLEGVAFSPPHPVTGQRIYAIHRTTGLGNSTPLRPGVTISRGFSDNPPQYTMGSVLWFFDPNYNNGEGKWCNLEWSNFEGSKNNMWGFWDTIKTGQFAGIYKFETDLSLHPCGDIGNKIAGINFGTNGTIGAPQTTVLVKNDLGDPNFLPINIPDLSGEAFNYLKNKSQNVASSGANYDLYNWILKTYGMPAAEWYLKTGKSQGNPYLPGGAYVPRASNPNQPPSPLAGAQDGDMFAFFGGNNKGNQGFDPTKKQNRRNTINLINAVNSGDPLYLPPGVTMDQAKQWVDNYNNGNLSETFKLRHLKSDVKNEDVNDNTKFNIIKKSRKKSKDIDEKIEYLDKECQKTGLNEITMGTSGVYQGSTTNPNEKYQEFSAINFNGYPLAMSGDGKQGHQSTGGASIRASDGAAMAPPHPVTGEKRVASTKGGIDPMFKIAIPGEKPTPQHRMTGDILWYYNASHNGGQGRWQSLEYNAPGVHGNGVYPGNRAGWGYWGSDFIGFPLLRDDEKHADLFAALNDSDGIQFNPDDIGTPTTTVFFQNELGDPSHLPIYIREMSPEAFEFFRRRVNGNNNVASGGVNYDLYNYLYKRYGIGAANWYENNPTKPHGSNPNIPTPEAPYVPLASNSNDSRYSDVVSDTDIPGAYAGAQDGDEFAFFGGGNNKNTPPPAPTRRTRKGSADATRASTGMYPSMTPEIFQQKYGISWSEYLKLP